MTLIDRVLSHSEFAHRPPVLVDIGASGGVHPHWRTVAKHCYCVAFDGDDREFGHAVVDSKDFKKLFLFHSLVVDGDQKETPFHLTASPFCSSTLPPDTKALSDWAFAPKFAVVKTVPVRSVSLNAALTQAGVSYVDWFKSDSQGTDLRLFRSLPENIRNGVLAVEFEPGFIDAYHGEDKLSDVLRFMEQEKFWLSDGVVKGSQRITPSDLVRISAHPWMQKMIAFSHRASPGWIEMTYLRSFDDDRTLRDHLLKREDQDHRHHHAADEWGPTDQHTTISKKERYHGPQYTGHSSILPSRSHVYFQQNRTPISGRRVPSFDPGHSVRRHDDVQQTAKKSRIMIDAAWGQLTPVCQDHFISIIFTTCTCRPLCRRAK